MINDTTNFLSYYTVNMAHHSSSLLLLFEPCRAIRYTTLINIVVMKYNGIISKLKFSLTHVSDLVLIYKTSILFVTNFMQMHC